MMQPDGATKALCVVCPEPGKVELTEVELDPLGPDQVLVEAEMSVVSPGTERAWFMKAPGAPVRFPYRPGYCHVGRVRAVGSEVRGFEPGHLVLSRARHASAVVLKADQLIHVPDGLAPYKAAFAPLGFISLQGVRKAHIELGSAVAVIGAGVIGLLALKLSKLSGAHPLIACDLSAHRREIALQCGATDTVSPEDLVKLSGRVERSPVPDWGFDAVIDATGHPSTLDTAIRSSATQGIVVLLGSTRGLAQDVDLYEIHRRGIHVVGAHGRNTPPEQSYRTMWTARDNTELVLRLMRDGLLEVDDLISDVILPSAVPGVFERLKENDEKLPGCVINWKSEASAFQQLTS